jgi:hypothetical protein
VGEAGRLEAPGDLVDHVTPGNLRAVQFGPPEVEAALVRLTVQCAAVEGEDPLRIAVRQVQEL